MINIGIEATRRYEWLHTQTGEIMYGIQVRLGGVWYNAMQNNEPLLFDTPEDRNAKLNAIRAELRGPGRKLINKLRETAH